MHARVNVFRSEAAVAVLVRDAELDRNAAWQAARMARQESVFHSTNLAKVVSSGWTILGENVAAGRSVTEAVNALENSPPHRKNLLEPRYRKLGVGVVIRNGVVYVVQIFEG